MKAMLTILQFFNKRIAGICITIKVLISDMAMLPLRNSFLVWSVGPEVAGMSSLITPIKTDVQMNFVLLTPK